MPAFSQEHRLGFWEKEATPNKKRITIVKTSTIGAGALGLTGLYFLWYRNYNSGSFRFFDDSKEWRQMDKVGHTFSTYQLTRASTDLYLWTGMDKKNAVLHAGITGYSFLTAVELLDGFSEGWGFSWSDIAANTIGTSLAITQTILFERQILQLKYSFFPTEWPQYRPNVLGNSLLEQILKDYNGQTYWLSGNWVNEHNTGTWPKWLNLSVGYAANGMLGAVSNGPNSPAHAIRSSSYLLSLDVDLSRIKTNRPALKALFSALNCLKIPAPAIGYNTQDGLVAYWLYY